MSDSNATEISQRHAKEAGADGVDTLRIPFAELVASERELLTFAVTPPRVTTSPERVKEIAQAQIRRLEGLDVDGLILYDLDDESDRNDEERPFPYLETMDPADYRDGPLGDWRGNAIVYRCAGKYDTSELTAFLDSRETGDATVFVGASSSNKPVRTTLSDAIALHGKVRPDVLLGGVVIPERHARAANEHERLLRKQDEEVGLFVSQVIYDTGKAKDLVSDYVYACQEAERSPARFLFTLSLCGSETTLDFLEWLGVDVPRWVSNELRRSHDTLEASYEHCLATARDLAQYCRYMGLPFGFNIESVSTRKVEIEATRELAADIAQLLDRGPGNRPAGEPALTDPTSPFPGVPAVERPGAAGE